MNEKYEIIIKENGEEKNRVSTKGFLLTAVNEDGIFGLAGGYGISGLELALMINENEKIVDNMWAKCGVTSRKERETICRIARMAEMAVEEVEEE